MLLFVFHYDPHTVLRPRTMSRMGSGSGPDIVPGYVLGKHARDECLLVAACCTRCYTRL